MATRTDKTRLITLVDRHLRRLGPKVQEHVPTVIAGLNKLTGDTLAALNEVLFSVACDHEKVRAVNDEIFTPEKIRAYMGQAKRIIMPWEGGGNSPPNYIRQTAAGYRLAEVTSWLGGFTNPAFPREHGWGWRAGNPAGQGVCDRGIVTVTVLGGMTEEQIREAEIEARDQAMKLVEEFYAREFPDFTVLHDEIPPFHRSR